MPFRNEHTFDPTTYRHAMNGTPVVMHCHHYMSLLTRLAMEHDDIGGSRILAESAEDSLFPMLKEYMQTNSVGTQDDRFAVGKNYYAAMGLGLLAIAGTEKGGETTLLRSHIDQGWVRKWGKASTPVNHFTRGYVAALFAAVFDQPVRSYDVAETTSIVKGDPATRFLVTRK